MGVVPPGPRGGGPARRGPTASATRRFVYTGDTDEEGVRVGSKLLWFLNTA